MTNDERYEKRRNIGLPSVQDLEQEIHANVACGIHGSDLSNLLENKEPVPRAVFEYCAQSMFSDIREIVSQHSQAPIHVLSYLTYDDNYKIAYNAAIRKWDELPINIRNDWYGRLTDFDNLLTEWSKNSYSSRDQQQNVYTIKSIMQKFIWEWNGGASLLYKCITSGNDDYMSDLITKYSNTFPGCRHIIGHISLVDFRKFPKTMIAMKNIAPNDCSSAGLNAVDADEIVRRDFLHVILKGSSKGVSYQYSHTKVELLDLFITDPSPAIRIELASSCKMDTILYKIIKSEDVVAKLIASQNLKALTSSREYSRNYAKRKKEAAQQEHLKKCREMGGDR
jgi:hypothetical protein